MLDTISHATEVEETSSIEAFGASQSSSRPT